MPDSELRSTVTRGSDQESRDSSLPLEQLSQQSLGSFGVAPALNEHVQDKPVVIDCPPESQFFLPLFVITTSSRRYLPSNWPAEQHLIVPANRRPNCSADMRIVWCDMTIPRTAKRFSTMRKLRGKRKNSQTAWAITSGRKRRR
jgi:hypothetical protein